MELSDRADALVFGRDPGLAVRLAGAAAVLFLVGAAAHLPARLVGGATFAPHPVTLSVLAAMFLAAAVGAYLNDGLLVAIALSAGIGLGFYLPAVVFALPDPREAALEALAVGTGAGVGVGVVGFVVGAGLWRLVEG